MSRYPAPIDSTDEETDFGGIGRAIPLLVMIAVMWVVEIVDRLTPGLALAAHGIHPRRLEGLLGIIWSPFLHSDWRHLMTNTSGLLILGALILIRGLRTWADVTVSTIVLGGLFTWLIGASGTNHIGASGIVFGYFGYLIGAAVFERSRQAAALALVAVMFYGSIWYGLIPQDGISWAGHAGGLLAGLGVARLRTEPRRPELNEADDFGELNGYG